ncbi:hypothetical protein LXL04_030182 [Taraxacum kok-saghyz]
MNGFKQKSRGMKCLVQSSQKTHWRIKTHLAISHLDVNKINNIVADMRKVLAKNPQVEQQKLHRRVFLDNVDRANQALLILISCFVKTSHFEEYLCVKVSAFLLFFFIKCSTAGLLLDSSWSRGRKEKKPEA